MVYLEHICVCVCVWICVTNKPTHDSKHRTFQSPQKVSSFLHPPPFIPQATTILVSLVVAAVQSPSLFQLLVTP